jgi:hypothetical protein
LKKSLNKNGQISLYRSFVASVTVHSAVCRQRTFFVILFFAKFRHM